MTRDAATGARHDTRERLLHAALAAFGHRDYEAVSTREIVDAAGANIAAISYHFGGKKALYLATAGFIATTMRERMAPALAAATRLAAAGDAAACRRQLGALIGALVDEILRGRLSRDAAGLILREQNDPTEAFDILYDELMEPLLSTYATLLARIVGAQPGDRGIALATHALFGQIVAFRSAQSAALRRLRRARYSADDVRDISATVTRITLAAIDAGGVQGDPT
ncbi:MAG: CerR family C-terminal domain-containing protein [Gammaproteobacteria bacterium]|nr:CerR family C-terminal domain-containing protein [Gammaproteobacteria bacterium]